MLLDIPGDLGERHLAASVVGEDVVVPRDGAGKIVVRVGGPSSITLPNASPL